MNSRVLLLAGLAALGGCDRDAKQHADAPPRVRIAVVGRAEASSVTYTGVVRARIEAELGFRVAGKISERLVDPGQAVRQGQPLMRLDPADLDLARQAADERLRAMEAEAERAATDQRRYAALSPLGDVSRSDADRAMAARRTSEADLRAARANARQAANAWSYAVLVADSDGVVTDVLAQPGQVVTAGAPVVRLARTGAREALVAVPEAQAASLPHTGTAQLYGGTAVWPATLREVSGSADPLTRTFAARYVLGGGGQAAPLGATVTVSLAGAAASAVTLPLASLDDEGSGPGVWVVGGDGTVSRRSVHVLALGEETVRLDPSTLKAGDRVVALGAQLLREGERVRVADILAARDSADAGP